jgi:hypothetical protein
MKNTSKFILYTKKMFNIISIFLFLFLVSCKAIEAPSAGFIKHPEMMYKDPSLPFHKVWFYRYFNLMNYSRIIINPVKLGYLLNQSKVKNLNARNYIGLKGKDDKYVANYFRNTFINAFDSMPSNRFKVVKNRGYGTLILDIAIVEIVPTKVSMKSAGAALMFMPFGSILVTAISLPIKAVISGTLESGFKSYIAFEAVLKDAMTGKVLAAYADRESEKAAMFSFKDYTYFAHIRGIIDEWAKHTVRMLNRKGNEKLESSSTFALNPL